MYVTALVCTHCGADAPARRALRRATPASARSSRPTTTPRMRATLTRERIEAGPRTLWRYADLLPVPRRRRTACPSGCSPLVNAPRLAEALGLRELLHQDRGAPTRRTPSRTASSRWPRRRRVELGLERAGLRLDRQPRGRRRRPGRGARAGGVHLHARRSRAREDHRRLGAGRHASSPSRATTTTPTGSAPSSPTSGPGRSSTSTCARTTRRARRRWRYETAEQLGWRLPDQTSRRSPRARSTPRSTAASASCSRSASSRATPRACTVPRPRAARPVADAPTARRRARAPCGPDTIAKSLAIGSPADGANALEVARADRRAHRGGAPTRRSSRRIGLLARTTGYFTETAGGVTIATLAQARARRADRPRRQHRRLHHRRRPEDARRRARARRAERIAADIDAVDAVLAGALR